MLLLLFLYFFIDDALIKYAHGRIHREIKGVDDVENPATNKHTLDAYNEKPCCICGSVLDAFKFKEKDGKIYCLSHYKKITKPDNSKIEKKHAPKKQKQITIYCACGKEIAGGTTGLCAKCLRSKEKHNRKDLFKAFNNERKAQRKRKMKTQEELAHEETKAKEILNNFIKTNSEQDIIQHDKRNH